MQLFTIGYSGKSTAEFVPLLEKAGVQLLIDIRRSNNTLYAGFTRARDLPYLLKQLCRIDYVHEPEFAPSLELLRDYQRQLRENKKDPQLWPNYVKRFHAEIATRPILARFNEHTAGLERVCFLCMEADPEHCHRRLLAEYIAANYTASEYSASTSRAKRRPRGQIEIVHL